MFVLTVGHTASTHAEAPWAEAGYAQWLVATTAVPWLHFEQLGARRYACFKSFLFFL